MYFLAQYISTALEIVSPAEDFDKLRQFLGAIGWFDFFIPAVAACTGAYAAFAFRQKQEIVRSLQREMFTSAQAFGVFFIVLNTAENFKKQIATPKLLELNSITNKLESFASNRLLSEEPAFLRIESQNVFQTIQPQEWFASAGFQYLSQLQFLGGRPLIFAAQIEKACASVNMTIISHNDNLLSLKSVDDHDELLSRIAGTRRADMSVDSNYRHHIEHLVAGLNEIVFFCGDLLQSLEKHQIRVRNALGIKGFPMLKLKTELDENPEYDEYLKTWKDTPTINFPFV